MDVVIPNPTPFNLKLIRVKGRLLLSMRERESEKREGEEFSCLESIETTFLTCKNFVNHKPLKFSRLQILEIL